MRPAQLLEARPRRLQWTIPAIVSPKLQFPRLSQSIPMPDTLPSLSQPVRHGLKPSITPAMI